MFARSALARSLTHLRPSAQQTSKRLYRTQRQYFAASRPVSSGSAPLTRYEGTTLTPLTTRGLSTAPDRAKPTTQTGFSYPGPRKLSEIVKLQLLTMHSAMRVEEIWKEYHADHKSAIGDVMNAEEYGLFRQRTQRCRHFVLPVPREGGYFTLLVQFQGLQCFMTFLEDYKTNAAGAQPYLTITLFDELLETKGVALVRGEVTNMLTRNEAKILFELVRKFYLGGRREFDAVVAFNEDGENFDFGIVLRAAGIA